MARAGRKPAIDHGPQLPAQGLLGDTDSELLAKPLVQIDDPPAHNAMDRRRRSLFDDRGQSRSMCVVEPGRLSWRLTVDQAVRSMCVELDHPVANDLQRHPTDPGRFSARRTFVDRRIRQKPSRLRPVLGLPGSSPARLRIKIVPKRNGQGKPPWFAMLSQSKADLGSPRLTISGTWYKALRRSDGAKGGKPPFDPVLMFKIMVPQALYRLSHDQAEFQIQDRLSFMRFLGLGIGDKVPEAKTVWLFREQLGSARATTKIGMVNLAYNTMRLVWHEDRKATA